MASPTLAIDTATAACSAALVDGGRLVARIHEEVGRGHAERLAPMVRELLREAGVARPDAVLVGCGPGSFTGVRVGIATAIGLAIGWDVPVAGIASTALLAAARFDDDDDEEVTVAMTGGHGELFVETFGRNPFASRGDLASLAPHFAAAAMRGDVAVGSGAAALIAARGAGQAVPALADAAAARFLPAAAHVPVRPIYGRAPDAVAGGRR